MNTTCTKKLLAFFDAPSFIIVHDYSSQFLAFNNSNRYSIILCSLNSYFDLFGIIVQTIPFFVYNIFLIAFWHIPFICTISSHQYNEYNDCWYIKQRLCLDTNATWNHSSFSITISNVVIFSNCKLIPYYSL